MRVPKNFLLALPFVYITPLLDFLIYSTKLLFFLGEYKKIQHHTSFLKGMRVQEMVILIL